MINGSIASHSSFLWNDPTVILIFSTNHFLSKLDFFYKTGFLNHIHFYHLIEIFYFSPYSKVGCGGGGGGGGEREREKERGGL